MFPSFNIVRIWLDWRYGKKHPEACLRRFHQAVDICGSLDLLVAPVLFNRWRSSEINWGTVEDQELLDENFARFEPYVKLLVGTHVGDKRILCWDLCNEPSVTDRAQFSNPVRKAEFAWIAHLHAHVKRLDPAALTCVGTHGPRNLGSVTLFEPFCDILTPHPYFGYENGGAAMDRNLTALVALAERVGKPVLSSETCWGHLDDARRARIVATTLRLHRRHGLGWIAYLLHTSLIADAHGPELGPVGSPGNLAFIRPDGTIRPGHQVFNDFCR